MPVTLRPTAFEDAQGVGAMHHQAWVDSYGSTLPHGYFTRWTGDDAARRWENLLAAPTPHGLTRLVADDDGNVCSFVAAGATCTDERFPDLLEIRMVR